MTDDALEEAVWHLRCAVPILQKALGEQMELPCPNCGIPMMCNADAGWMCGNSDPDCRVFAGPLVQWGPYMAELFLQKVTDA